MLCGASGSCKHCCKHVAKVGNNNFFTESAGPDRTLILRGNFLHNTKRVISGEVQQEEREKNQGFKHPQGRIVSVNEMRHQINKYPEVYAQKSKVF